MLVVGSISSMEEQREVKFIAEMFIIGERFRFLGKQQKDKKDKK